MFADVDPVFFVNFGHFGEGGFAEIFEIVAPNGGDGSIIIVPEFAFVAGAIGGDGGVARVDGLGFAIFVEEVGEANFEEDVVFFDVFLESVFVFDDGVFKGDAIGADEVGVDDEIVFGFEIADGHLFVPDLFGVGRLTSHTGGNSSDN